MSRAKHENLRTSVVESVKNKKNEYHDKNVFKVSNKTNPFVNVGNVVPTLSRKELDKLILGRKKVRQLSKRDKQTKILIRLGLLWKKHLNLRLGQFIGNVIETPDLYYASDENLLNLLENFYKNK